MALEFPCYIHTLQLASGSGGAARVCWSNAAAVSNASLTASESRVRKTSQANNSGGECHEKAHGWSRCCSQSDLYALGVILYPAFYIIVAFGLHVLSIRQLLRDRKNPIKYDISYLEPENN